MFNHNDNQQTNTQQSDPQTSGSFGVDLSTQTGIATPPAASTADTPSNNDFLSLPSEPSAVDAQTTFSADTDNLLSIKQQALNQLAPLVSHLEQSPEEKFKTTMMMIQASDNHSLIKDAYEAAQGITDQKTKAQALLDIVNEINYFTHQSAS